MDTQAVASGAGRVRGRGRWCTVGGALLTAVFMAGGAGTAFAATPDGSEAACEERAAQAAREYDRAMSAMQQANPFFDGAAADRAAAFHNACVSAGDRGDRADRPRTSTRDRNADRDRAGNDGIANVGQRNPGLANVGMGNTGVANVGSRNPGIANVGERNSGIGNVGCGNSGIGNVGNNNSGIANVGNANPGVANVGSGNSGLANVGGLSSAGSVCDERVEKAAVNKPRQVKAATKSAKSLPRTGGDPLPVTLAGLGLLGLGALAWRVSRADQPWVR